MSRADLILQTAALCDHVDLLARQLRLYAKAPPCDAATHAMVRAARRMVRKAKRAK